MRFILSSAALLLGSVWVSAQQPAPPAFAPSSAVKLAASDVQTIPAFSQPNTRYLWVHRGDAKERQLSWQIVSAWTHALSRERDIIPPPVVLSNGAVANPFALKEWQLAVLVRVDLTHYRWAKTTWDKLGEQDPYFHVQIGKFFPAGKDQAGNAAGNYLVTAAAPWLSESKEDRDALVALLRATNCTCPILRADNWLWQVAIQADRKVGYYGLLEITDQTTYERSIGFDPKANVDPAFLDEILCAVGKNDSGIAQQNRRVERRVKLGGGYWLTKDNKSTEKEINNPLRTLNGGLKFDASETFGHLANGMWAVGLFDKDRKRQDSAPDFVGFDRTTHNNDARIHVGLSCFSCHADGGLQDIRCWFRKLQLGRGLFPQVAVQAPASEKDQQRIHALKNYLPPLETYLSEDRQRYANALNRACGLAPKDFASKLRQYYAGYDAGVDFRRAAEDLGVTPQYLNDRLEKFTGLLGQQDTVLATFMLPAAQRGTIGIEDWHAGTYNRAQLTIRGLVQWPDLK